MSTALGTHHLGRLVQESFERRGDYDALLFDGRWHRAAELLERAQRLAAGLASLGVAPGDRVVVAMANCPEVTITYYAVWLAGAVVTPATFVLPAAELRHIVADSGARAVVTTPDLVSKIHTAVGGLEHVSAVVSTEPGDDGIIPLRMLEQSDPRPIVPRADEDLAALLYTGGTTGRAKGVMLSHANLYFTGRASYEASHVTGVTRGLMTLPLSHAYGLLVTMAALHAEEPRVTVLEPRFDPATALQRIVEHRLQMTAVVPTMLQLLLGMPLEEYDLSSLQHVTSGGAPLAPEVEREFCRRVPSAAIRQGYGMTETAALISANPAGRVKPGSVGLPVPGTDLEVRGPDGRPLPPGEIGEICVRSPGVMRGYWNAPEATSEALGDGWLHTGDVGYVDGDGYLFIVDRMKDLIIRGGFNVYPRDVEDGLMRHESVRMAAVVGRPSARHGEEVVAFVALAPGSSLTGDELVHWAREEIGGYRYPREVHVVDAIPLTSVGKIDRKALRAEVARGSDAAAQRPA